MADVYSAFGWVIQSVKLKSKQTIIIIIIKKQMVDGCLIAYLWEQINRPKGEEIYFLRSFAFFFVVVE
jgi:hypothetical protein